MMANKGMAVLTALCDMVATVPAFAGTVLIVNGSSATSEPSTTSSITTQISSLHTAAGNVVTVVDALPIDLAGFSQVWDIRFSTASALNGAAQSQYLSYLQGGGGIFLMGENSNFAARNASILSLISSAGGGSLNFTTPDSTQTVYAPFNGPNGISSVSYNAPGGVDGFGTGQWITSNAAGTAGSGVAFGVGTLANATAGALTTIFDVNFLQTNADVRSQALTRNLIGFIGNQVEPPSVVPEPATWTMMLVGFGAISAVSRRNRRRPATVIA